MEPDFFDSTLCKTKHFWQRRRVARYFDPLFDSRIASRMREVTAKARQLPSRSVLVASVDVPGRSGELEQVMRAMSDSHHFVQTCAAPMAERGKFANINEALKQHDLGRFDWLIITDDDVVLPADFMDVFIFVAETMGLSIAQPAHRCLSYTTFTFNYRKWNSLGRTTRYVESGPVTAFHRDIIPHVVPFPPLRWAWGVDIAWSVTAERLGMPIGIVDCTPLEHIKEVASTYDVRPAIAEAREFLNQRNIASSREALFVETRVVRNL